MEPAPPTTILLVEDEGIIAMAEKMMLQQNGYEVVTAADGESAIRVVAEDPAIDLVLMDIDLGRGMSGTEAAVEILRLRDIPVVFLSSHTEPEVVQQTEDITSYGYIVKNAGPTVMLASLRMAFKLHDAHRELKYSNEELRWWDRILRYVVEHDTSAVAILDDKLRYLYVSKRWLTDHRVEWEEIIGRGHYEVFPEIPPKWREVHRRALEGEVQSSDNDYFVRRDGRTEYTRWACRPWYRSDDSIGGIILYTEVVTELVAMQHNLKRARELETAIVTASPHPVISVDPDGIVTSWNPAATRLFGWTGEEAIGTFLPIVPEDDRDTFSALRRRVLSGETITGVHLERQAKDGRRIPVEMSAVPIRDGDGTATGVVAFMVDRSR